MRQAAAQASEKLNVLPSEVVGVWSGGTSPKRMDEIVREIADEIVALQAAMADHAKREKCPSGAVFPQPSLGLRHREAAVARQVLFPWTIV